jgi:hypothetical protein
MRDQGITALVPGFQRLLLDELLFLVRETLRQVISFKYEA